MKTSGLAKWGERVSSNFRLFLDALKRFNEDHCFLLSSGIAFALLLCLIPLLLLVLALIGTYLLSDQEVLNHISEYLKDMFPSLDPRITESILEIVQDLHHQACPQNEVGGYLLEHAEELRFSGDKTDHSGSSTGCEKLSNIAPGAGVGQKKTGRRNGRPA